MIRALGRRVLVRVVLPARFYGEAKLLHRPDAYRLREPGRGVVLSVGDGCRDPALVRGEFVVFRHNAGDDFGHGGETLVFLEERDVLALLPWPDDV